MSMIQLKYVFLRRKNVVEQTLDIPFAQYQNLKCSIEFLYGQQFDFVLTLFTNETNTYLLAQ